MKNRRGRPKKSILTHPDRHAIPFALALIALGKSEREAFYMAAMWCLGTKIQDHGQRHRNGWRVIASFEFQRKGHCGSFKGLGEKLKQDFHRTNDRRRAKRVGSNELIGYNLQEIEWLEAMFMACCSALVAKNTSICAYIIETTSIHFHEEEFAERVLWPIFSACGLRGMA